MCYIGQSERYFKNRKREHRYAIRKKKRENALFLHVQNTGHTIDFDKAVVIDTEARRSKRLLSEMINIQYTDGTMNSITDTDLLKFTYKKTINCIRNIFNKRK